MGVFDTVRVACPDCGNILDFQSKGGFAPYLCTYDLAHTPKDVLSDVNQHGPESCHCGAWVIVDTTNRKTYCVANHQHGSENCHCGARKVVDTASHKAYCVVDHQHESPEAMTDRERLAELKQIITTMVTWPDGVRVGLPPRVHDLLNVDVTVLKR